ncbi:hypothetical protein ACIQNG_16390 [Streptomyces sp. NPDC091377]|uniref:hypothetical protein n=1 Tax=Streptomyces sp. NPDC091377 TaxID=3365995 RepID=UPI003815EFAC
MHGHGYPQPVKQQPSTGVLVFLRVLFVVIAVCSLGFLSWAMMLRLALVTRKGLDWGLFVAVSAADVLAMVLLGSEPGDEIHTPGGWTGLALLLGTLVAGVAYYLAADIRHFYRPPQAAYAHAHAHASAHTPVPGTTYGYPQPQPHPQPHPPYTATTVSQMPPVQRPAPTPPPPPPAHHTPPPATPVAPGAHHAPPPASATPPPQRPARIDQVRAELDELSDYLRNRDGQPDGNADGNAGGPAGGRQGAGQGDRHEGGR